MGKPRKARELRATIHHAPPAAHDGCDCHNNPAGTTYYTSARRDNGDAVALTGPYLTHVEALAAVPADRARAYDVDPRAPWYAYGTFAAKPGATIKPVFEKEIAA